MKNILFLLSIVLLGCAHKLDIIKIESNFLLGEYESVIESSTTLLPEIDPKDKNYKTILLYRADSYVKTLNYSAAIKDFNTLLLLDSTDVALYSHIYYAYWTMGKKEEGLPYLEKGYALNPNDVFILNNLSFDYSQNGQYEKSIAYSTKGLELNPDKKLKGLLLNNRGFSQLGLKRYKEALKDINASISFFPDNSFAYYYRAQVYIELKKWNKVCRDLSKAKQLGGEEMTKELMARHCSKNP